MIRLPPVVRGGSVSGTQGAVGDRRRELTLRPARRSVRTGLEGTRRSGAMATASSRERAPSLRSRFATCDRRSRPRAPACRRSDRSMRRRVRRPSPVVSAATRTRAPRARFSTIKLPVTRTRSCSLPGSRQPSADRWNTWFEHTVWAFPRPEAKPAFPCLLEAPPPRFERGTCGLEAAHLQSHSDPVSVRRDEMGPVATRSGRRNEHKLEHTDRWNTWLNTWFGPPGRFRRPTRGWFRAVTELIVVPATCSSEFSRFDKGPAMAGQDRMTIEQVVAKVLRDEHADVIRESVKAVAAELMEAEVSALIGTSSATRPDDRATAQRLPTQALGHAGWGDRAAIPKLRQGSYFPGFLTPRNRTGAGCGGARLRRQHPARRSARREPRAAHQQERGQSPGCSTRVQAFRERAAATPICSSTRRSRRSERRRAGAAQVRRRRARRPQSGRREIIGLDVGAAETEAFWTSSCAAWSPAAWSASSWPSATRTRASRTRWRRSSGHPGSAAPSTSCATCAATLAATNMTRSGQ